MGVFMKRTKLLSCLLVNIVVPLTSACNSTNGNADSILPPTNGAEPASSTYKHGYMDKYFTFGDEIYGAYTFVPTFEVAEQLEDGYIVDYCFRFLDYGNFDKTKDYLINHFNVVKDPYRTFYNPSSDERICQPKSEDDFIFDYDNLIFKIRIEQKSLPRNGGFFKFIASPDNVCNDQIIYCEFEINII